MPVSELRKLFQQENANQAPGPVRAPIRIAGRSVAYSRASTVIGKSVGGEITSSQSRAVTNDVVIHNGFENVTNPCILFLGQTGGGKSAMANTVLGKIICKESSRMSSCTDDILVASGRFYGTGVAVTVIDTPGFLDSENRDAVFLVDIVEFLRAFPKNKLGLVVVTLPLLETRAKRTYYNMIDQIEILLGANVWDNTVFVTTMEDQLSQPETASTKKADWEKYLKETCLIPHPVMINYVPAIPQSLEPLRSKYATCKPITPELSTKIEAFLASNPGKSPSEAIEGVERLKAMKLKWEDELQAAKRAQEQALSNLRSMSARSQRQEAQIRAHEKELQVLQKRLAEKPQVVYQDVHHHHHHNRCSIM